MRRQIILLLALAASVGAEETVRGVMQAMPGDPLELIDAGVRRTPTNFPFLKADDVKLRNRDLVLGVSHEGGHWAIPIRFLGLYEVLNLRLSQLPVAATW